LSDEEIEEFEMPEGFECILEDEEMSNRRITNGISLLWAPKPFNQKTGYQRRSLDITLVSNWFQEKCP
jgi:pre-mRNA-processing factor 8